MTFTPWAADPKAPEFDDIIYERAVRSTGGAATSNTAVSNRRHEGHFENVRGSFCILVSSITIISMLPYLLPGLTAWRGIGKQPLHIAGDLVDLDVDTRSDT